MPKPKECIYTRNGIWGIRYDIIGPNGKRQQKRESCGRGASQKDAEALLRTRLAERDRGVIGDATNITLEKYLQDWIRLGAPDRSPTTNERYEQLVRLHIAPAIGYIKLAKLKPLQIQGMLSASREGGRHDGKAGGLAPKTVKHLHTLLHAALEQAVKWQMIAVNPAHAVQAPRVPKKVVSTAENDEIGRLLAAIANSYYRIPILLILSTGMRRGEVCGLKWEDFDLQHSSLIIRRALIHTNEGVAVKGTKTDRARTILLDEEITAALIEHRQNQGENLEGWICLNAKGGKLAPKSIDKAYRRMMDQAGVSIRMHGLRHTWATRQILAGVPDDIVAQMLGHSTTATTHNLYTHPRVKHQVVTLDVTKEILKQKPSIRVIEG